MPQIIISEYCYNYTSTCSVGYKEFSSQKQQDMWIRLHRKKCEQCRGALHMTVSHDAPKQGLIPQNAPPDAARLSLQHRISESIKYM